METRVEVHLLGIGLNFFHTFEIKYNIRTLQSYRRIPFFSSAVLEKAFVSNN